MLQGPTQSKKDLMSRNESHTSFHSMSQSLSDLDAVDAPGLGGGAGVGGSMPGTPLKQSLTRHLYELEKKKREDEDMYTWMQRQQVRLYLKNLWGDL